jgi:hypothetical protein
MRSQEGKLGLTLLQRALQDEEQQQQQQQQQQDANSSSSGGGGGANKPSLDEIRAQLAAAGNTSKRLKPKLPGFPKAGAAAAAAAGGAAAAGLLGARGSSGDELLYDDEEEDWDEDEEATPSFQITFDEQGRAVSRACGADRWCGADSSCFRPGPSCLLHTATASQVSA